MEPDTLLYIAGAYFFAGFIKGFSGLGFGTVCVGIMAGFLEMTTAIPLVLLPSILSCFLVMIEAGHFSDALRRFAPLYIATLPGLGTGIWILLNADGGVAKAALGVVLCIYGFWGLANPNFKLTHRAASWLSVPTGYFTGLIHGLTGAAVMPIAPYLLSLNLSSRIFVQAINISFAMSGFVIITALGMMGYLNWTLLLISIAGSLPMAFAVKLGSGMRRRASDQQFKIVVLIVLIALGVNLIAFN